MDAFAELGLTPNFELSPAELETRYLALMDVLHPDRYVDKMPAEKLWAQTKTAAINHAYQLLKNPSSRARCILESRGIDLTRAESTNTKTTPVLFEIMELREQLTALEGPEDITAFDTDVQQRLQNACKLFVDSLQQDDPVPAYLRLTYLYKIVEEIKQVKRP